MEASERHEASLRLELRLAELAVLASQPRSSARS